MNTITVNGKTIKHSGNGPMCISGDKITIGGVEIHNLEDYQEKVINIVVEGDVTSLSTDNADITVKGSVGSIDTKNGSVHCKDVQGDVTTKNGSVSCGKVSGSVDTKNGNISRGLFN